jgi:hypothetical protein
MYLGSSVRPLLFSFLRMTETHIKVNIINTIYIAIELEKSKVIINERITYGALILLAPT